MNPQIANLINNPLYENHILEVFRINSNNILYGKQEIRPHELKQVKEKLGEPSNIYKKTVYQNRNTYIININESYDSFRKEQKDYYCDYDVLYVISNKHILNINNDDLPILSKYDNNKIINVFSYNINNAIINIEESEKNYTICMTLTLNKNNLNDIYQNINYFNSLFV